MDDNSTNPCDDLEWALQYCPQADADPCCFPQNRTPILDKVACSTFMMVGVVGIVGNLLNLVALPHARRKCKDKHSPLLHTTTILVISLSLSDLLFSIGIVSNGSTSFNRGWPHGPASCTMIAYMMYSANATSTLHLAAMAVNRCLGIWMPRVCKKVFGFGKGIVPICLLWIIPFLEIAPLIHSDVYGYLGYNPRIGFCTYLDIIPPKSNYKYINGGVHCLLPMVLIIISSILILIKVKRSSKDITTMSNSGNSAVDLAIRKRERRLTTIFTTISVVYFVTVIPYVGVTLANVVGYDDHLVLGRFAAGIFYAINFAANFFIYAFRVPSYRDAYKLTKKDFSNSIQRMFRCISETEVNRFLGRSVSSDGCGSSSKVSDLTE